LTLSPARPRRSDPPGFFLSECRNILAMQHQGHTLGTEVLPSF
jgi:hypothetical protein